LILLKIQVLEESTRKALASPEWLKISSGSVSEFLQMERLNINEADLVRALIRWAQFQSQQEGDDLGENLRSKILPGLRQIKFASLTQNEIAQLYQEELGSVLTGDEKCAILISIVTGKWNLMPTDINPFKPVSKTFALLSLLFVL
jgi:BTB And C-terminal Kelch